MNRRTSVFVAVPILAILAFGARPVLALWVSIPVTKNAVIDGQEFTITTKNVDQFTQFDITIKPHPNDVSPFVGGQLSLISDDKWVASVPISERRKSGEVTYSFRVVPAAIAQSSFEISASNYEPTTKDNSPFGTVTIGKQKYEQQMGGIMYNLKLKDFAGAK